MSKKVTTRIQVKHDTTANWEQAASFKPLAGELIVYEDGEVLGSPKRFKIGDGTTLLKDLPFATEHNHDSVYSKLGHNHNEDYYVKSEVDARITEINTSLDGKAAAEHTHDEYLTEHQSLENYYTKEEVNAELATKAASDHDHDSAYSAIHEHPYLSDTTNYAGSNSQGGSATSANKVNSSLKIQLNGGTATEFDGSAEKTVNITPSSIDAAASEHTHDYAEKDHSHSEYATISAVNDLTKLIGDINTALESMIDL